MAQVGGGGVQNEAGLRKSKNWHDLESDLMLHLGLLKLSNRKGTSQGGQHQKCSTWWGLGWGARNWESLV